MAPVLPGQCCNVVYPAAREQTLGRGCIQGQMVECAIAVAQGHDQFSLPVVARRDAGSFDDRCQAQVPAGSGGSVKTTSAPSTMPLGCRANR